MVEFVTKFSWGSKPQPRSIGSAVEYEVYPEPYGSGGVAEDARTTADKTATLLGRLMERLHAKGVIDDQDVLAVLGSGWKINGAPDEED